MQKRCNMEQKSKTTDLQWLLEFIENSGNFRVFDKEEDNFTIEAPNNATWQIQFEKDSEVNEIVSKTIKQLEEFDADERFTEWWSADFAKHNGFTPSQFIRMLQEDEASFKELAMRLRKTNN